MPLSNPFLSSQLLNAIQEGVIIYGRDGRYKFWNEAMLRMTGVSRESVIGHTPEELFPIVGNAGVMENVHRALRGERPAPNTFRWEDPRTGHWAWVTSKIAPLISEDGAVHGAVATISDITERRQAEETQDDLTSKLHQAQKMESLGILAGGVAHDMNNVLGAIMAQASLNRDRFPATTTDPVARGLDTIHKACLRGRAVVKSLLAFAHRSVGESEPLDLNAIVHEIVDLIAHATFQQVELVMDLDESLGLVEGDPVGLGHALMNLCVNSVDAMPDGGKLTISTRRTDGHVEMTVSDTGVGMPPEVLAKATEPFFTTKPIGKGTGLGLAMVYGITESHNGTLDIQSAVGVGTTIRMRLPSLSHTGRLIDEDEASCRLVGRLKILVVDDDPLFGDSMLGMLERMGHEAQLCMRGKAALDLLEQGLTPDLVILDMNMPGMTGGEVLAKVLELRPDQRVLIATGYSEDDVKALVGKSWTVDSIQKPFSKHELTARIAEMFVA